MPETTSAKAGNIFDLETVKVILSQVGPYRRRFVWTGCLVVLLSSLVWIRPALIRQAVDVHIAAGDLEGLFRVFMQVVAVLLVEALVQYRVTYLANWVAQSVSLDLRAKLYRHVSRFRLKYFDQTPVGALVTRHVSDIDGVAGVFSNGILERRGGLVGAVCGDWRNALHRLELDACGAHADSSVVDGDDVCSKSTSKAPLWTFATKWPKSMNLSKSM